MVDVLLTLGPFVALALYGTISWALIARYRKSGNLGFLILGAGVVLTPVLSRLIDVGVEAALERGTFSPVTEGVLTFGEVAALSGTASYLLQAVLILWGVLMIGRGRADTSARMVSAEAG